MFLAVTPLREFWNTDEEMLFIGPWCLRYGEKFDAKNVRHRFLPDPFRDLSRYAAVNDYCRRVSDHFLPHLAAYLNSAHGTRHDIRYWRLLLDPWLTFHVEQMCDHYIHVEDAFRLDPDLTTTLLDPSSYETPRDTADFVQRKVGDRFHLQIFSQILSPRLPASRTAPLPPSPEPAPAGTLKSLVRRAAARALTAISDDRRGTAVLSELELSRSELLRLSLRSALKALPFIGDLPPEARPAARLDARRRGLAALPGRDDFERLFASALPVQLPAIFLEGYAVARRATMSSLPRYPKVFFSSVGWHYIDSTKFAAAECAARGARLWGIQHGGSYGMAEFAPTERIERAVTDRYFTWGWSKNDGDPKLGDLPSPLLSRSVRAKSGNDLLFVSTILDHHHLRLVRDTSGDSAVNSIDRKILFYRALPEIIQQSVRMRLYRRDFGWRQRERLVDAIPGLTFDDSTFPLARRLRQARLVVMDYPSTPMLEALAADIPCLLTWAPDTWTFRPIARPYFDALRDAGIYVDDPKVAAAEAAKAYEDPRGWWNASARQAARREFIKTFALSDPRWLSVWLKNILDEY